MSTAGAAGDEPVPPHARRIAPGLAAPVHQHLFCARLDIDVDGAANEVYEVGGRADAAGRRQPVGQRHGGASRPGSRPSSPPGGAIDPARSRTWRIVNPGVAQPTRANRSGTSCCRASTPDAAGPPRLEHRPTGRVRDRRTCGSRPTTPTSVAPPVTTRTSTPAATGCPTLDRRGPIHRRHRRRGVAHLRGHPRPAARGLAGHARRVRRVPPDAGRVLRRQPGARRAGVDGLAL